MSIKQINNKLLLLLIMLISLSITSYLASRYSVLWSGDADAANSPIVWRAFLDRGFDAFTQWKPTFDNWYFTVYPVNFLFFAIFGDDGLYPLLLSSILFIFLINTTCFYISYKFSGLFASIIAIATLTFTSPDLYSNGYLSHPFSHNSTNAYGFIIFALYLWNIHKKNIIIPIICATLSLTASVSDPWLLASFFLPMILTEISIVIFERKNKRDLFLYVSFFIIAASNIVQYALDLPVHSFKITTFEMMLQNINTAVILTSKILPIFAINEGIAAYFVFFVWFLVVITSAFLCFKAGGKLRYLAIFSVFSIAGIYSSSIIGDQVPHQRFYLNIVPIIVVLCASSVKLRGGKLIILPLVVTLATSLALYINSGPNFKLKSNPVEDYIFFLEKNDLKYGYGSFWGMTMGVNWLSEGNIHITPVYFHHKTGEVNFKDARVQTMKFWHTREFITTNKPSRQFIAISKGNTGDRCKDVDLCVRGVEKQIGKPDETLNYHGIKFLIYNSPINTSL
ncbi:hypothetical protein [Obesumbacterium proteus]|uniref:GtrI family protein n=1 Tax=Obesumbacterium proteus ATCC 12841 TaxID=1354268 RepID=A0AA91IRA7_9GAMM|nr:hypothetical protein [Obesumbacterium proteus]AMO81128.1 hypothetical protein DSM2777_08785 [Obesumbacterium proteus]OAT60773.1 GtrI family protein [Obesumbacterium proteus ATCC 12841]